MDIPGDLQELAERLPDASAVRARIEATKREAAFLRRLLKVAIEAERASDSRRHGVRHEA